MVRRKTATVVVTTQPRRRRRRVRASKARNRTSNGMCDEGRSFVRCAIDPFGSDSARVPTGTSQRTMHVKYTCMVSGKPRSGQTTMAVSMLPGLPGSLRLLDGTFTAPDRSGSVGSFDVVSGGAAITVPFADFFTSSTATDLIVNGLTTNIATAKVVGYGLEVRASSTIINQGGAAVTAKVPAIVVDQYVPNVVSAGPYAGVSVLGTGLQMVRLVQQPPNTFAVLQQYPDSKMCSGTEPCRLVGEVDDYEIFYETERVIEDQLNITRQDTYIPCAGISIQGSAFGAWGGTTNTTTVMVVKPLTGDQHLVGDFWTPQGTQALCWAADSLTADSLYEFKVVLCIEATVSHYSSSIYRPFVSKAPPRDEAAMAMARRALQAMPASLPPPDRSTGNWWSILSEAVTGFGDIVGGLDIPVVSGVARAANRLAKLIM